MKSDVFKKELQEISNEELRHAVTDYFEQVVPDYFWTIPASSSGKYHPEQDLGDGGLVRHTRMVTVVAIELLNQTMWSALLPMKDQIIAACLMHDTFKNGKDSNHTIFSHPNYASHEFYEFIQSYPNKTEYLLTACQLICQGIEAHMGQWNTSKYEPNLVLKTPNTPFEKFVHLCDYIASRNFIGNLEKY